MYMNLSTYANKESGNTSDQSLYLFKSSNIPSLAAPKSGPFSPYIMSTKSLAYLF